MFDVLLQAATEAGAKQSSNILMTIVPFVLIFVVFYFFLIRPQNKKQKETEKMISALKKGDKVVTIGGIHGTVTNTKENTVFIRVDDNTKIEINRSAVSTVISDKADKNEEAPAEEKKLFGIFKKKDKKAAEDKADSKVEKLSDKNEKTEEAKTEAKEAEVKVEEETKAEEPKAEETPAQEE